MTAFTPPELDHYARHVLLPEVGLEGQRRLKNASVLLVGAGGLGSPAAMYLAAAGVGRLGIIDADRVEASNLQRQILHGYGTLGEAKVDSALARLRDINPHIELNAYNTWLDAENALAIVGNYDVVVDGADNFRTRYLVNDACVLAGKRNVYGSIFRFEGQLSVFGGDGPCYRCLYPTPPTPGSVPSCAEGGVLGVLPGIIGVLQATEAIKILLGIGESMAGRLLLYDALGLSFRELRIPRDPQCAVCGEVPSIKTLEALPQACDAQSEQTIPEITADDLRRDLRNGAALRLVDVREQGEWDLGHLAQAEHVPLNSLVDTAMSWPRDAPLVLYCRSGRRSQRAGALLKDLGFTTVDSLAGGILAWPENALERST